MTRALTIDTPRWALALLKPARYKGAYGGRGGGKSHFFAERLVEEMVARPDLRAVGIREVLRSIKFSSKRLIEDKIEALGVGDHFDVMEAEIRRVGHDGVIVFNGMQDHTAESIKSLEGFEIAWVEEAQSLSARSLELLLPTIRAPGSEIWCSWNPAKPTDPVDQFFRSDKRDPEAVAVEVNLPDNPFVTDTLKAEAARHLARDPETYAHVWQGAYQTMADQLVFSGCWRVEAVTPERGWDGPYYGLDFGFSQDPTAAVRCWLHDDTLFVEREAGKVKLELSDTAAYLRTRLPGIERHTIRADSARPESISHLRRHGLAHCKAVAKGKGSVEDGIAWLRGLKAIVIDPSCTATIHEMQSYSYRLDKRSGDVTPAIVDADNHYIDAIRYALEPMIKRPRTAGVW